MLSGSYSNLSSLLIDVHALANCNDLFRQGELATAKPLESALFVSGLSAAFRLALFTAAIRAFFASAAYSGGHGVGEDLRSRGAGVDAINEHSGIFIRLCCPVKVVIPRLFHRLIKAVGVRYTGDSHKNQVGVTNLVFSRVELVLSHFAVRA